MNEHQAPPPRAALCQTLAALSLCLAAAGTAGSLYLSLGLGLKACPLCFYQRSFVMGVAAILAVGLAVDRRQAALHSLVALPLSIAGLGVAAFHEYLVIAGRLECPFGVAFGTAPAESLAIFTLLALALAAGAWLGRPEKTRKLAALFGTAVLGAGIAWASIASAPPLPPAPTAPYDPTSQPLDMCRPPYRSPAPAGGQNGVT